MDRSSLGWSSTDRSPPFNFSYAEAYDIMLTHSWPRQRLFSDGAKVCMIVVTVVLVVVGCTCNGIVCYVMGRRNQRRIARNLYVLNLAISDMTLSIVCTPFTLLLMLERTWAYGDFVCRLLPVVQGANILVSVAAIAVIAVDRYCTIVRTSSTAPRAACGIRHSAGSTWQQRSAVVICVAVWMSAFAITLPLAFFQAVEEVTLHGVVLWRACVECWPTQQLRGMFTVFLMLVQYVIPTVVLATTHIKITHHLRTRGGNDATTTTAIVEINSPARRVINDLTRYRRATITLVVVTVVFAASWLPLHVVSLLADFQLVGISVDKLYMVFAGCHFLAMTTACSNPILYGVLNTNFRREVAKLIGRKCRRLSGFRQAASQRQRRT